MVPASYYEFHPTYWKKGRGWENIIAFEQDGPTTSGKKIQGSNYFMHTPLPPEVYSQLDLCN